MKSIFWSELAQEDYWQNIDYLERKWTEKEAILFIQKVEQILKILKENRITFKPTNYQNTYQIVVVKQITLYYHLNQNNDIVLLRFFNNFQKPDSLKI